MPARVTASLPVGALSGSEPAAALAAAGVLVCRWDCAASAKVGRWAAVAAAGWLTGSSLPNKDRSSGAALRLYHAQTNVWSTACIAGAVSRSPVSPD